ncbi:MAG: thiamine-phosphate kinase [Methylovirgula sp.]|uniref:thiamine-phosphate kinase n=1 Tax=Methylovirgula sp. TaxID=1978224 RepID=UPI003076406A
MSEDELIATIFAPLAGPGGLRLEDDAALLACVPGEELVLTKDLLVAGVHFFADDPPDAIARKALRQNLSDLAAKAAEPKGFLLGLVLPADWQEDWLRVFASGLADDAAHFDIALLGGDTVCTPGPLTVSITALGSVPQGEMVPRGAAKPGDHLFVTGTIGDSALGLKIRQSSEADQAWIGGLETKSQAFLRQRYLLPQPRLGLCAALRAFAHAAMDISDGLAGDLAKMLRVSGVTAEIAIADVPLSAAAQAALAQDPALIETLLSGGDDYEILAAVPPEKTALFEQAAAAAGIPIHCIGIVAAGTNPPVFRDNAGQVLALKLLSYAHF